MHPKADRRIFDRPERKKTISGRRWNGGQLPAEVGRAPDFAKPLARLLRAATGESIRQHDSVDRTCRCAGNAFDSQPAVFQEMVKHAPGKCAERASTLQREI